jgi:CBS domain-containing protein
MKVRDIMTRGVITVPPEMSVRKAAKLMLQYELSGFPVVEPGRGLVGMITEGDLVRRVETGTDRSASAGLALFVCPGRLAEEYARAHGRAVGEVMTRHVISIGEDASLEDAVRLMEAHHVKRLPVLRNGGVVGMISRGTLLHAFVASTPEQPPEKASDDEIRKRLAAELSHLCWLERGSVWAEVEHGVVNLSGTIGDERERLALRVLAENIPGVTQVHEHLVNVRQRDRA